MYASKEYERGERMEACMQRLLAEVRETKATLARIEAQTVGPFQRLEKK